MFSSIRWKFVFIYFLLIFIAMVISGVFIINKLESEQIVTVLNSMEQNIDTIKSTSSYLAKDDLSLFSKEIQNTINDWRLGSNETIFVIVPGDVPRVIASSIYSGEQPFDDNIYSYKFIDPIVAETALAGEKNNKMVLERNEERNYEHFAAPIYNKNGKINGVLYMITDLKAVHLIINESRKIILSATLIALSITVILGFIIASSITVPIRDVTLKASKMALGDFTQHVEVKSNDEIGKLASMFNHLTNKLNSTITEMNIEKSKLDTIFNYMTDGVLAVDLSGTLIHANSVALNILNYNDIYSLDETKVLPQQILDITNLDFNSPESLIGEAVVKISNVIYKVKYGPFKTELDLIDGLIIVFQDVTKEHKLDSIRKEFVANVSHELKTPITTIKSYTETLMGSDVDSDTRTHFLNVINIECDRMTRLVRDLLDLSNLDYSSSNWNIEKISIDSLIKGVLEKLSFSYEEKHHDLTLKIDDNISSVYADEDAIERVFINIISNAIKYTPDYGKIKIELYEKNNFVNVVISDNGIGIPEADKDKIFDRFYRVEKGRSREMGGTGLGLSIAKEIIEGHQGEIELQSSLDQGTIVSIKFPINGHDLI